ncbi:MAG: DUF4384 domain-containing protein [Alphaproteobacteria bacterium]
MTRTQTAARHVGAALGAMLATVAIAAAPAGAADPTPGQQLLTGIALPQSDLKVAAWLNRADSTYAIGDTVELYVRASQDAFITIFNTDATGRTTVIFPNQFSTMNKVTGNTVVRVPAGDAPFRLQVGGPAGANLVKIVASKTDVSLVSSPDYVVAGNFRSFTGTTETLARQIQAVTAQNPTAGWASSDMTLTVAGPAGAQPTMPSVLVAAVTPPPVPAPAPTAAPLAQPQSGFKLQLVLQSAQYKVGEAMAMTVTAEKDCRLTLISVDEAGGATVLFPNKLQEDNMLRAGRTRFLPGNDANVEYQVAGATGTQTMVALCTEDQPGFLESLFGRTRAAQPVLTQQNLQSLVADIDKLPPAKVGRAAAAYAVVAGSR